MPRPRERVCLQDGLKLDLNGLALRGFIRRGARSGPIGIRWISTYWDEELASGTITADMSGTHEGWLQLQGDFDEWIELVAHPRHFGGRQWYFMCPAMNRAVSVLWRPPGARRFRSRLAWGRQVAYASQFSDPDNRAHLGKSRIKARLIADLDPNEWICHRNRSGCDGTHTIAMRSVMTITTPFWTTGALRSLPSSEKISFEIRGQVPVSQEISLLARRESANLTLLPSLSLNFSDPDRPLVSPVARQTRRSSSFRYRSFGALTVPKVLGTISQD